jgi:predicted PurR-regulated permease PerM
MLRRVIEERLVRFRARTILVVLGLVIGVAALLEVIVIARHVLVWVLIALFLTLALNPLVEFLEAHGLRRRGAAVAVAYVMALLTLVAIGALFIPTLVHQVNQFADAVPGYVDDVTKGKGRFGFLETKYHVVEKIRKQV